jgi:hypothetical protein
MSISPISAATAVPGPASAAAAQPPKVLPTATAAGSASPPVKSPAAPSAASSHAALLQAALQEATETAAQTLKEANGGDRQAQRLLAKSSAARPVTNSSGELTGSIINTKA